MKTPTLQWLLTIMLWAFIVVSWVDISIIDRQRDLIRQMSANPACMGVPSKATPAPAPPKTVPKQHVMIPSPPITVTPEPALPNDAPLTDWRRTEAFI